MQIFQIGDRIDYKTSQEAEYMAKILDDHNVKYSLWLSPEGGYFQVEADDYNPEELRSGEVDVYALFFRRAFWSMKKAAPVLAKCQGFICFTPSGNKYLALYYSENDMKVAHNKAKFKRLNVGKIGRLHIKAEYLPH